MASHIVDANDVIGVDVKNMQDESLGKIETLMIDKITGEIAFVVLSFGGFLGIGDKLFAMPWNVFAYDENDECFKVPFDKEKLKNSPGFDKAHWPDMSSSAWQTSIHSYYDNDHKFSS